MERMARELGLSVKKEEEEEEEVVELVVVEALSPRPIEGLREPGPPPFLVKTFDMVENPATDEVVSWSSSRNSFVVWDAYSFSTSLLPKYFKHCNFSSFVRQLNTYGFRKIDPDRWEFANESFLGGQRHLLKNIKRRRNTNSQHSPQNQQNPMDPCVELLQFGHETEIERLRRDRQMLIEEILKLKQQQQSSRSQVADIEQRLNITETKHKNMMKFLAKALKNPTLIQQLKERHKQMELQGIDNKKKRRLPSVLGSESLLSFPEETSEANIDSFISFFGNDATSSSTNPEIAIDSLTPSMPYVELLEELLSDDQVPILPISDEGPETDAKVEDLVVTSLDDWDDVQSLVEQMEFLVAPKP